MIIEIADTNNETYYINPKNVIYIKERGSHQLWKIVLINGEVVMTKDEAAAQSVLLALNES